MVWGPGHVFPVSGALVSFLDAAPAPIPDGAYCERCAGTATRAAVASAPDGTFAIEVAPGASGYLAVEKGQFRIVTPYTAPPDIGEHALDESLTTLPSRSDPAAGRSIPRIALVYGDYDAIQDVLAKAGMGDTDGAHALAWGSEAGIFDVYDNHGSGGEAHGDALLPLLRDRARLLRYHVVFFACSYNANFSFMEDPIVQQNLREYVRAGGKLYVSDYAYAVVELPWPELVWFDDPLHGGCVENRFPDGCNHGPPFDSPSRSLDVAMSDWLLAIDPRVAGASPHAEFETLENWNTIGGLFPGYAGDDPSTGMPVTVTPTVVLEGPWSYRGDEAPEDFDRATSHPLTITFPFGCGKVLYTTYHTVGGTKGGRHPGFHVQELVLWYSIMDLQVCTESPLI